VIGSGTGSGDMNRCTSVPGKRFLQWTSSSDFFFCSDSMLAFTHQLSGIQAATILQRQSGCPKLSPKTGT
jgi:hypothetical protein